MDPEFAELMELMPGFDLTDVTVIRGLLATLGEAVPLATDDRVDVVDRMIPGPPGAPDLAVRIYTPRDHAGSGPGLAYFHGGAFVLGDLDAEQAKCLRHAADGGNVVVSVDYRLAPEHRFPAGLEDCYAGLCWMVDHADELGVDPSRVAVGGSSAGGALSAAVALLARDRGGPPLAFQLLVYPVTDDRLQTPSVAEFVDLAGWNGAATAQMWDHYLGADRTDVSPYAAPNRAADLAGLPPTLVVTAEFDPLRDEGLEYGVRLQQAGVRTELHHYPGAPHGFDLMMPDVEASQRAIAEQVAAVQRALGG